MKGGDHVMDLVSELARVEHRTCPVDHEECRPGRERDAGAGEVVQRSPNASADAIPLHGGAHPARDGVGDPDVVTGADRGGKVLGAQRSRSDP